MRGCNSAEITLNIKIMISTILNISGVGNPLSQERQKLQFLKIKVLKELQNFCYQQYRDDVFYGEMAKKKGE